MMGTKAVRQLSEQPFAFRLQGKHDMAAGKKPS
jgi:hypothetical protein